MQASIIKEAHSPPLTSLTMTSERAPLSLRIAAFLFVIEGVLGLVLNASIYLHNTAPELIFGPVNQAMAIANGLGALLSIAIGIGILYRRPLWRTIGAWAIGLGCGYYLAVLLTALWPMGPISWDSQSLVLIVILTLWAWQFWAITNRASQIYFRKGIQPPRS